MGAMINYKNNTITCKVADEKMVFEFSKALKQPMVEKVWRVDLMEAELDELERVRILGEVKLHDDFESEDGGDKSGQVKALEALLDVDSLLTKKAHHELPSIQEESKEESSTPPSKVESKPSPFSQVFLFG